MHSIVESKHEYVMSLPPEEQQALLEQYPELAEAMTLIQQEAPTM